MTAGMSAAAHLRSRRPRRVLILLNSFSPGGAGRLVAQIVSHIDRKRCELRVASLSASPAYVQRLGFPVRIIDCGPSETAGYEEKYAGVHTVVRELAPDLVLAVVAYPSPHLTHPPLEMGIPALTFITTDLSAHINQLAVDLPEEVASLYHRAVAEYFPTVSGLLTHGRLVAASLQRTYGRPVDSLLPNMPMGRLDMPPMADRDRELVLSVGRLYPEKGHASLIRAMTCLPERVRLDIIGDGPEEARYRRLIADLGLQHRVGIRPLKDDETTWRLIAGAGLLALPSRYETMPAVLLDAMEAGTPIVATAVGEIPDLVADLYPTPPSDSPEKFGLAMAEVLENGDIANRVARARERVRQFHPRLVMERWAEVFSRDWSTAAPSPPELSRWSLAELLLRHLETGPGFDLFGAGMLAGQALALAAARDMAMPRRFDWRAAPGVRDVSTRAAHDARPLLVASMYYLEIVPKLRAMGMTGPIYAWPGHY